MSSTVNVVRATSLVNIRSVSLGPSMSMHLGSRSEFGDIGSPCLTPLILVYQFLPILVFQSALKLLLCYMTSILKLDHDAI